MGRLTPSLFPIPVSHFPPPIGGVGKVGTTTARNGHLWEKWEATTTPFAGAADRLESRRDTTATPGDTGETRSNPTRWRLIVLLPTRWTPGGASAAGGVDPLDRPFLLARTADIGGQGSDPGTRGACRWRRPRPGHRAARRRVIDPDNSARQVVGCCWPSGGGSKRQKAPAGTAPGVVVPQTSRTFIVAGQ